MAVLRKKNKKKTIKGPVSTIFVLTVIIALLSLILNKIGFQSYKSVITNGNLEASLVTVNNIISLEGLKFIIGNVLSNFKNFEPLFSIIIALIGISICEKSGFLDAIFSHMKKFKYGLIIFITLFIGIIMSMIGDYSYMFLTPLVGVMYKCINKNPIVGILTLYLGITLGYGTGILFNYNDHLLGALTQASAVIDVDKNYIYHNSSSIYIMLISAIVFAIIGYIVINKFLTEKFTKKYVIEEEELNGSKKGIIFSLIAGLLAVILVTYFCLDIKLAGAGILIDKAQKTYAAKLFSPGAAFSQGIVIIISLIMMLCGAVYGKISKNIKNSSEYSLGLSKSFDNLGLLFVLMFFTSQMVAILDWTNIGVVLCSRIMELISSISLSGILLIIVFFVSVIVVSIFIPSSITKWELMSPTIVPLFMRSNISPDFTQFIFKIADSVGKALSPTFVYFIITLAFMEKYRNDDRKQTTFTGTLKTLMPTILIIAVMWILLLCLWYLGGFPIGIGTASTL